MTDDQCMAYLNGHLWGDGEWAQQVWHLWRRPEAITIRLKEGLGQLKIPYTFKASAQNPHQTNFTINLPVGQIEHAKPPPLTPDAAVYFVCGVIEGEGGGTKSRQQGLVIDDPHRDHVTSFCDLLTTFGILTTITGTNFFQAMASPEDWIKFQSMPFAAWGRVPGGAPA